MRHGHNMDSQAMSDTTKECNELTPDERHELRTLLGLIASDDYRKAEKAWHGVRYAGWRPLPQAAIDRAQALQARQRRSGFFHDMMQRARCSREAQARREARARRTPAELRDLPALRQQMREAIAADPARDWSSWARAFAATPDYEPTETEAQQDLAKLKRMAREHIAAHRQRTRQ